MKRIIIDQAEFDKYVEQLKQNETKIDFAKDITVPNDYASKEVMTFMAGYITAAKTLKLDLKNVLMSDLIEEVNRRSNNVSNF